MKVIPKKFKQAKNSLGIKKMYEMQLQNMNFAMKMSHVRLSSSYHNHFHLRCTLQNFCDRFEDILVFHDS